MVNKQNHEQDIRLITLETKVDNLDKRVDKFITNEFFHFKQDNETAHKWVMGLVVLGILIPILLYILK